MKLFGLLLIVILAGACLQSPSGNFDSASQFAKDTAAIKSYLKTNNIKATGLNHGVWYIIDSAGVGVRPAFQATMKISYKMRLMSDGSIVDQTSAPVSLILGSLISGIRSSMPYFQNGSKGRIFIPSYYAYQNVSSGSVPANSNLIFEFKLYDVIDNALKADTTTIKDYLASQTITALKDFSGMRYTIDTVGTGLTPQPTDSVTISYSLKTLSNGVVIGSESNQKYLIADLMLCLQIAMPKASEGGVMSLYVPSSLEYLPYTTEDTPRYSNLLFNVKLIKVSRN